MQNLEPEGAKFPTFLGGNGMRVLKQFRGFPKVWEGWRAKSILRG